VKFLVDAQLPARLARHLSDAGHDARHTSDLPGGNASTDAEIAVAADAEDRVVVTKDRDFRDSHLLRSSPRRLCIVSTGNIANDALIAMIDSNLAAICSALEEVRFVEVTADRLIVHNDVP